MKPILQFGLAASVSSVAVLVLGALMSISYLLTAYDDASRQSRTVSSAATKAKTNLDSGLQWGKKVLDPLHPTATDPTQATSWVSFVLAPWRLWDTSSSDHQPEQAQSAAPTNDKDARTEPNEGPEEGEKRDTSRTSSAPPPRLLTRLA